MERLTSRYDDGEAFCDKFAVVDDVGVDETILKGKLIDKLAEYEDAEEQGLLLKLPCPIGTTVYKVEISNNRYIETAVSRYEIYVDSVWFCFKNGLAMDIEEFNKTVFLTKEEAEQVLSKMKGE